MCKCTNIIICGYLRWLFHYLSLRINKNLSHDSRHSRHGSKHSNAHVLLSKAKTVVLLYLSYYYNNMCLLRHRIYVLLLYHENDMFIIRPTDWKRVSEYIPTCCIRKCSAFVCDGTLRVHWSPFIWGVMNLNNIFVSEQWWRY